MIAPALLVLALSASAADLGGHAPAQAEAPAPVENREAVLEEMWARRILSPDQGAWAPADAELLGRIRTDEGEALVFLKRRFGTTRDFTAPRKGPGARWLTKAGHDRYLFLLSQDAIEYFENKGAGAKWALKLTDWDGKRLFDGDGRLTAAGVKVYTRAKLKLETYWKSPNGETFGTRRPPAASINKQP